MNPVSSPNEWYLSQFDAFEKTLNGESKSPLHLLRREAIDKFHTIGFPTSRNEEWRYTSVAPIAKAEFKPVLQFSPSGVTRTDVEKFSFDTRHRLVFINGHFASNFSSVGSLPEGVVVGSLASAVQSSNPNALSSLARQLKIDETPFVSLNTAFLQDGAFIFVPEGIALDDSIQLLFIASEKKPFLVSPRNLVIIGNRGRVSIVESYVSLTDQYYLTNAVTEIVAGDESIIEHDKLQNESRKAFHVAMIQSRLGAKAQFTSNSIAVGGAIVRNNVTVVLDAEHSECTLNGLSLGTGTQLIDNHTTIDHAKPNCASHELYKAILDGKSRGVFNGKIFVRPDAQKTDAKQTNKTLLLSDEATVDTKPQLEIFADDVKCTHGATVGQLDAEQVFYLRSRGIGEMAAKDILTFAFASDVVSRVHVEPLKRQLESLIHERLDQGRLVQLI
ncbi:MAG: Fe-S cluster assembly protein SufD [Ignavibacteriales bacterium]|nr:Fe-S cluster assembly protein SufD [Ignavibacteriales bacterium]